MENHSWEFAQHTIAHKSLLQYVYGPTTSIRSTEANHCTSFISLNHLDTLQIHQSYFGRIFFPPKEVNTFVHQGLVQFIKSDSYDFYIVSEDLDLKQRLFFWTFYSLKNPAKMDHAWFPQKYETA